ncbi:hypothetical protein [Rhodococcus sp. NPDC058521]|uniref:hypothetical protein n=1 Tax=Rhodococcus sp. NPDC058521 TaxID=3346536 RepID=UPI0036622679
MKTGTDPKKKKSEFAVGSRVKTRHSTDQSIPEKKRPLEAGEIVDEFGGVEKIDNEKYGRDWGVSKRWAVALDIGTLVFRDDIDLEAE